MLLGFVHSDGLDHEISHFEHTITEDQLALSLLVGKGVDQQGSRIGDDDAEPVLEHVDGQHQHFLLKYVDPPRPLLDALKVPLDLPGGPPSDLGVI